MQLVLRHCYMNYRSAHWTLNITITKVQFEVNATKFVSALLLLFTQIILSFLYFHTDTHLHRQEAPLVYSFRAA